MKILKLTAENVKRLRAVEITPDNDLVIVGGRNGAGKSSVLDSIMYVLGGTGTVCEEPLRRGEKKGSATVDLGDIIVTRTFTDGGGTLAVKNKDGAKYPSPQKMLDALVGRLSFDPLAFSRMEARDQARVLRDLVGLDTSALDAERATVFAARTGVNAEVKQLAAQIVGLPPRDDDAPFTEESASSVVADIEVAQTTNRQNEDARRKLAAGVADVARLETEIARMTEALAELKRRSVDAAAKLAPEQARVDTLVDVDVAPMRARLAGLESTNRAVRANAVRSAKEAALAAAQARADAMTTKLASIDTEKQGKIAAASFPLPGLGFGDAGVTLGGLPFAQASSAEQLRASLAIGIALNPKLRVMLVRDGSLLDADSLRMVAEMAAQNDAQVWIERVGDGEEVGVLIEDGAVAARSDATGAA